MTLQPLDFIAIAVYFVLTAAIGLWTARGRTTSLELFLAGRSLGPVAVGFSLFSSNMSSDTLLGLPGEAYRHGISVASYEWMASLTLVVSAYLILPVLVRSRVATIPEFMERRFDARLRKYLSGMTLVLVMVVDTSGGLYAGALVLRTFLPGLEMLHATLAIALFTALYTAAGGLRAVVYTDVMQTVVLLLGSATLALIVFGKFDFSWAQVLRQVPPEHLHLVRPSDDPGLPWIGLLTGVPVACFYYWNLAQHIAQRVLGARDLAAASRGAMIAGALKLLPLFLMTLPGALAIPLLPGLEQPDQAWPAMVARFVPAGLAGIVLAGLLAALMSTCSATLNSAATLLVSDFVQPARPGLSSARSARIGRVATVVFAVGAGLWAPNIQYFPGLWAYLQELLAYIVPPVLALFTLGLACRGFGPAAALRTLASAHAASALLFGAKLMGWLSLHYAVVGSVVFAITLLLAAGWMRALGAADRPAPGSARLELVRRDNLPRLPLDVRLGALAVLLGCLGILLAFA
ncbi:MAG: sodium/solute symporter [Betaproteobacteria bacterium]|nr:sodium/solute symporter [Betaproteobacteria bacterium]MDE1954483.1 sodium/solute symporter [Betaproteobacteria bacterium]MDE2151254.1 sodium/solute symporter [Betaproteobacteria bacterium]